MRVLIDIRHAANVHLFEPLIRRLQERGDALLITSHARHGVMDLMAAKGIEHHKLSVQRKSAPGIIFATATRTARMLWQARKFRPDVLVSCAGPEVGAVGMLLGVPVVTFDDVECARLQAYLQKRLSTVICTNTGYAGSFGRKERRFNAPHQFVYTHPTRFSPNADILRAAGINPSEPYMVLRLTSWQALHDIGCRGSFRDKALDFVNHVRPHARVLVSTECPMPPELKQYANPLGQEHVLHLLAFARLLVSEGASMPAEAACLGTPAIWVNPQQRGYLNLLSERYGLVERIMDPERVKTRAVEFLTDAALRARMQREHRRLLDEFDDPLEFMVNLIDELGRSEAPVAASLPVAAEREIAT